MKKVWKTKTDELAEVAVALTVARMMTDPNRREERKRRREDIIIKRADRIKERRFTETLKPSEQRGYTNRHNEEAVPKGYIRGNYPD